ncbi:MAG: 3-methyl-2-oxobutanoate hydroxymethyltransferase [Myxococcota bacterium]
MNVREEKRRKITARALADYKAARKKITAVTCYDYTFARLIDAAGIDIILVGDSLGNVIQGEKTTLKVSLDEAVYHARCVARGVKYGHVVGDLPFGSYQASPADAFRSSARFLSEGECEAVKLEGGAHMVKTVEFLVERGIPVMAHLGFTPQSVHKLGVTVQGVAKEDAERLKLDAKMLEDAGAYSLVLEMVPAKLAAEVSRMLTIPTIGIGAGAECDGQVLVLYDLLGLNEKFNPKFLKKYENFWEKAISALERYKSEVVEGIYPDDEHSF